LFEDRPRHGLGRRRRRGRGHGGGEERVGDGGYLMLSDVLIKRRDRQELMGLQGPSIDCDINESRLPGRDIATEP
jgi:hypothetical protein